MTVLFLATRNRHKVEEIRSILGDGLAYSDLRDLPDAPELIEDTATFEGNAAQKAIQLAAWLAAQEISSLKSQISNSWVLADDSGLEVDALGGAPGVHSARFAAIDRGASGNSSDADNNAKLLRLLGKIPTEKRTARFRCVIALVRVAAAAAVPSPRAPGTPSPLQPELFAGACEGRIISTPSGRGGFGYDPLFVPEGSEQTFAELGEEVKNRISHRAKALAKLSDRLRELAG